MIVLLGESGAGKSTLQKMLIESDNRFHRIVAYTTRPKRKNEKDKEDYCFITEKTFEELKEKGFFAEVTRYRNWWYGTTTADCKSKYGVAVMNPVGFRTIKRKNISCLSIYIDVDRESRLVSSIYRGDNIDEAYRRNLSDEGLFAGIEDEVDAVINNAGYHMTEEQVLKCLLTIIDEVKNET